MKLKQFDLVELEWNDALSDEDKWAELEDYDFADLDTNLLHRTTGYLIRENKIAFTVAQSLRDNKQFILGIMTVPKGCIVKMRKLK